MCLAIGQPVRIRVAISLLCSGRNLRVGLEDRLAPDDLLSRRFTAAGHYHSA